MFNQNCIKVQDVCFTWHTKSYPTMVIKAINTFITTSTMFAELAHLQHKTQKARNTLLSEKQKSSSRFKATSLKCLNWQLHATRDVNMVRLTLFPKFKKQKLPNKDRERLNSEGPIIHWHLYHTSFQESGRNFKNR